MADLGTLRPGAGNTTNLPSTGMSVIGAPGGSTALSDDADGTFDGQNTNASGGYEYGRDLADTPANFVSMDAIAIQYRYGWSGTPSNTTWDDVRARIVTSDGATVLAGQASTLIDAWVTIAANITTTTPTNSSAVSMPYVNTGATKAQWDGAILQIKWDRTRSKGGSTEVARVYEAWITGTYTSGPITGVAPLTGTGTVTATASAERQGVAPLTGSGTITAVGTVVQSPKAYTTFSGSASGGWDTPELGGDFEYLESGATWAEGSGVGTLSFSASAQGYAYLTSMLELTDTVTLIRFTVDVDNNFTYVVAAARVSGWTGTGHGLDNEEAYWLAANMENTGAIGLTLTKRIAGSEGSLDSGGGYTAVESAGSFVAGEYWWLELTVTGTSLEGRVWKDGTSRPSSAQITGTDNDFAQGVGGAGAYNGGAGTKTISYNDLNVYGTSAGIFGVAALDGTGTIAAAASVAIAAAAALDGTGSITAVASLLKSGIAALTGSGTVAAVGSIELDAVANLTGAGSVTADATVTAEVNGIADLAGTATITANASVEVAAAAALDGTGTVAATASLELEAVADLAGTGSVAAVGSIELEAAAALAGTGSIVAAATAERNAAAALTGSATVTADGFIVGQTNGAADLVGSGAVAAAAALEIAAAADLVGSGTLAADGSLVGTVTGIAALAGTASVTAAASRDLAASAALSASGSVTAQASIEIAAAGVLAGSGALSADGSIVGQTNGIAALTGAATLTATGSIELDAQAALTGAGTLAGVGTREATAAGVLSGSGALQADSQVIRQAIAALVGTGTVTFDGYVLLNKPPTFDLVGALIDVLEPTPTITVDRTRSDALIYRPGLYAFEDSLDQRRPDSQQTQRQDFSVTFVYVVDDPGDALGTKQRAVRAALDAKASSYLAAIAAARNDAPWWNLAATIERTRVRGLATRGFAIRVTGYRVL